MDVQDLIVKDFYKDLFPKTKNNSNVWAQSHFVSTACIKHPSLPCFAPTLMTFI